MSDGFTPWEPRGLRPGPGTEGPDPDVIVRRVRLQFLLAGLLAAAMVTTGLNPAGFVRPLPPSLAMTAATGLLLLALLAFAWWRLHPDRLVVAGKRALDAPDARRRRPRAEWARATGFAGLATGWAMQAILLALLPVLTGLLLQLLHDETWPLLAFAAVGLAAGVAFQRRIARAVHRAVEDPELRNAYGSR
jgi:hypothetical protein